MIRIEVQPGRYVVAVSGGVDSMVLLHIARQMPGLQLVVAHANHGIRADSALDEKLVRQFAVSHNILYETAKLHLGKSVDEATARKARYTFLRQVCKKYSADGLLVAHHKDDLVETTIINMLRGTGWRGLAPFALQGNVQRPLLKYTKKQLMAYARSHHVPWREDSTNTNQHYLRNYVRHTILPQLSAAQRQQLLRLIRKQVILRRTIHQQLDKLSAQLLTRSNLTVSLNRYWLIMLPPNVSYNLLQHIYNQHIGGTLQRPLAQATLLFAKVARPGKIMPLGTNWQVRVSLRQFIVEPRKTVVS